MASLALPRFYPIIDTSAVQRHAVAPVAVFEALIEGGAGIVQLRHKGDWTRDVFGLAEEMAVQARDAGVTFVVNDRADVALAVGASGVHLGQTDLTPSAVRSFAGDRLIVGLSTHNEGQLRAAADQPADYLALGPIFGTQSKERPDPVVGTNELARLRSLSARPLVGIGGITRRNAASVWSAGADSCAVIADYLSGDWRTSIEEWIRLAQDEGGT